MLVGFFFFVLGFVAWYFISANAPFDNIKGLDISATGLVMKGDLGFKWALKKDDINEIILVDGSDGPEEKIAGKHGCSPIFAAYLRSVGRAGSSIQMVATTPILYLPKNDLPKLKELVSAWKKELVPLASYSEEKLIEKDDWRRLRNFANASGNKKVKADLEKELGPG